MQLKLEGIDTTQESHSLWMAQIHGPELAKTYMPKVIGASSVRRSGLCSCRSSALRRSVMYRLRIEKGKDGIFHRRHGHSVKGFS